MDKTVLNQPLLSILIPAYNEEQRLPDTLDKILKFLAEQSYTYEILVIENGSNDRTLDIAREYAGRFPFITATHLEGRGKGLAVRQGMAQASGQYRFICDADLSMPIEELNRFLPPLMPQAEVVIASREAKGAQRIDEPAYRHFSGRLFNWVVQLIALPGLSDTQCGFKCFQAQAAEDIFPYQTIEGWSFDVEVLYIARLKGYRIKEIPIRWYYNAETKVRIMKDLRHVLKDLWKIRQNARRGVYDAAPRTP
jgi:dolichyl-phosphate beta-glucosyltransferase